MKKWTPENTIEERKAIFRGNRDELANVLQSKKYRKVKGKYEAGFKSYCVLGACRREAVNERLASLNSGHTAIAAHLMGFTSSQISDLIKINDETNGWEAVICALRTLPIEVGT